MSTRTFPLQRAPRCNACGRPAKLNHVKSSRAAISSGSVGRPFYSCSDGHRSEFITWNDNQGVERGNPNCACGYLSRKDSSDKSYGRTYWYACSSKECRFREEAEAPSAFGSQRSEASELDATPPRQVRRQGGSSSPVSQQSWNPPRESSQYKSLAWDTPGPSPPQSQNQSSYVDDSFQPLRYYGGSQQEAPRVISGNHPLSSDGWRHEAPSSIYDMSHVAPPQSSSDVPKKKKLLSKIIHSFK